MGEKLPARIKYWLTEAKHDCYFVVGPVNGPTERIGAMKTLLMGDSEPFRAMLQDSDLAEKGDVRVKDVEPETFRNFLICVYGGSSIIIPQLTFEESAKLLYVIEKYLINDLKTELFKHMKNLLSSENLFVALSHPMFYQEESLRPKILDILKFDFDKITKDDKFLELSYTAIEWILQVQYLPAKEIEIWNAILRWARQKTDPNVGMILRPKMLGLLKYIRFLTMDFNEFCEGVVSSEILLENEINDICRAFVLGKPCNIEYLCNNRSNRFNTGLVSKHIISSFIEYPRYAFIRCCVSSVSDLQTCQRSKTYHWTGHLWHLQAKKGREGKIETLGVWVYCDGKTSNWNCEVNICVQLINQTGKRDDVSRSFSQTYNCSQSVPGWGWNSFYDWNALLNPDNGFIKDNKIILVAKIKLKNM